MEVDVKRNTSDGHVSHLDSLKGAVFDHASLTRAQILPPRDLIHQALP
jgi:hypothetical protein